MKIATLLPFLLLAGNALAADDSLKTAATDPEAIAQVWSDFGASWSSGDARARAALFSKDASLITPTGVLVEGRAALEKQFSSEATSKSTYLSRLTSVSFPASNVAIADVDSVVSGRVGPDGKTLPDLKVHVAAVHVKKDGRWQILSARPYVFITPPPAKH